jgi:hypothetical protein
LSAKKRRKAGLQLATLQERLDDFKNAFESGAPPYWLGYPRPRRLPAWCFLAAAAATELYATVTRSIAPLTRDFIRIGMSSSVADTSRRAELVPRLAYPTLEDGISLLHPASASQGRTIAPPSSRSSSP